MKIKEKVNTLSFKLCVTVIIGIGLLSVAFYVVNLALTKEIFVDTFSESQQKIFNQIDRQFYDFYTDMLDISDTITLSASVKGYLTLEDESTTEARSHIYYMQKQVGDTKLSEYAGLNVLLIGKNGKSYIYNHSDKLAVPALEIVNNEITRKAAETSGKLICEYQKVGYSDVMKSEPVIVMCRAIRDTENEVIGCLYLTIKESDFRSMYNHFTSSTSDIVVMNGENMVISSNNPVYLESGSEAQKRIRQLAREMQGEGLYQKQMKEGSTIQNILYQRLQNTNYRLLGIVNPEGPLQNVIIMHRFFG